MAYKVFEPTVSTTWATTVTNLEEQLSELEKDGYDVISVVPFSMLGSTNRLLVIAREKE